jgi:peptidoglycan/LPS O-acetylase OafA/YrhL
MIVGYGVAMIGPTTPQIGREIICAGILLVSCLASLGIAYLAYTIIEKPMIDLGRAIIRRPASAGGRSGAPSERQSIP